MRKSRKEWKYDTDNPGAGRHGEAAEILGIRKYELIELYDKLGQLGLAGKL